MKIERDGKAIYVCECGKEFEKRKAFIGHCSRCETHLGHESKFLGNFKCKYCEREFNTKVSLITHEKHFCSLNPNKEPLEKRIMSDKQKQAISKAMKGKNIEKGNHYSYGKRGYYKGFYCASSYELAFVIYYKDHNLNINRNTKGYKYNFKGEIKTYFPDFIINDSYFVEIKGYKDEKVDYKLKAQLDKPLKIYYLKDLDFAYKYIKDTYNLEGINIIKLYDDYETIYKRELEKERVKLEKFNKYKDSGQIDSLGHLHSSMITKKEWENRKEIILNSGVDLTKYGYLQKLINITGLSKHILQETINHFNLSVFKRK